MNPGKDMNTVSTHPSIIWFTVHKSASVFIAGLLKKSAPESGMNYIDYEGNFWQKGEHFFQEIVVKNPQKVSEYFPSQERLALSQVKLQHYQNLLSQYTHV